jgi:hypothetical protein
MTPAPNGPTVEAGDGPANKVKAALDGALGFLELRDEVVSILVEYLSYSIDRCEIEGRDECAERIIVLFADLLTERPAAISKALDPTGSAGGAT